MPRRPARCRCGSTPRPRPSPTGCWSTSTAARSSWAAWTPTTTSPGRWPRRPGYKVVSVGYRLAPEHAFPAGLQDCYGVVRWAAEHGDELGWDGEHARRRGRQLRRHLRGRRRGDGPRRRASTASPHQVLFYPSLDLDFDESTATRRCGENAVGLRPGDGGAEAVQRLLPRQRRGSRGPARLADQACGPHRAAAGADRHGRVRPAARRGRAVRPTPAARPGCAGTVSRYAGANHGFVQTSPGSRSTTGSSRRRPSSWAARDERREHPPARLAVGPVRALQLLHRRAGAGHRRHRDRLVTRRGHGPGARGARAAASRTSAGSC